MTFPTRTAATLAMLATATCAACASLLTRPLRHAHMPAAHPPPDRLPP